MPRPSRQPRSCHRRSMARITYLTTIDFGPGELATPAGGASPSSASRRPLLVSDARHRRERAARPGAGAAARRRAALPRHPAQPDRGRGARRRSRSGAPRAATASWRSAAARRSTSPRAWRCSPPTPGRSSNTRRSTAGSTRIGAGGRPGHRDPDHRRHRRRGRPRGAADPRRRPQARLHQPAPDPEAGDLRPGADARPAAGPDRGHRARRAVALHRDLPLAARQPAGRGDRARRRRADLAQPRARLRRRQRPRGARPR